MPSLNPIERRVWTRDTARQGVDGLFESLKETVFLLVAIQFFGVSDFLKGTIGAAGALGMFFAFFLPALMKKFSLPVDRVIGFLTLLTGIFLVLAGFAPTGALYTAAVVGGLACFSLRVPLFAQLYSDVYHGKRRARLFNYGRILLMVVSLVANFFWGGLLEYSLTLRWVIYLVSGGAMIMSSFWLFTLERGVTPRVAASSPDLNSQSVADSANSAGSAHVAGSPAAPAHVSGSPAGSAPFISSAPVADSITKRDYLYPFSLIWKDPVFGAILGLWFLIGFANLWSLPLRVSYISDAEHGLGLSPQMVITIMGVIPLVVRLIFSWVWAHLFDKINMIFMRVLINLMMGVGIFLFLFTHSVAVVLTGSIIYSIASAGAPIIWNLWVTRVAPEGKARDYMIVHTGMTGIRGLVGPYLGFWVASSLSVRMVGTISLTLACISAVGFLFLLKSPRLKQ